MARGYEYHEEDEKYAPSRPSRRRDSHRQPAGLPASYAGGHYAESPIQLPVGEQRTLAIVNSGGSRPAVVRDMSKAATLPAGGSIERRTRSAIGTGSSRPPGSRQGPTTVSKVTRSRSLTSRPAGISVYHPPNYARYHHSTTDVYPIEQKSPHPSSRPGTRMSSKSGKSHVTSNAGKSTTKAGVVVETMSAPNPFCPNTRGVCCLMVLVNLALILVAIGFIIVLQLHDPAFVWNIGVVILTFGFFTIFVALVYCMCICQETQHVRPGQPANGELYWTHHWQKNITIPEIKTHEKERWAEQDRFPEDDDVDLSDTSSRDYPRLYLESDYGQRTDREADFETEQEAAGGSHRQPGKPSGKYDDDAGDTLHDEQGKGRY